MKYFIKKDNDEITIKSIIVNNGVESEKDFNYIEYINCYLSQKEAIVFVFSQEIDEETKNRIIKMDSEIKKIVSSSYFKQTNRNE